MHIIRIVFMSVLLAGVPLLAQAADHSAVAAANDHAAQADTAGGHEQHALPPMAISLGPTGTSWLTNSMIVSWIVALGLILFAQYATRKMKDVPDGAQNFWEWMVESLRDFLEGIIGRTLVKKTFWFFATIFIFIVFCNWVGLIPGLGTMGWGHDTPRGFVVDRPLFRGANADLNMTLAMAIVFFACWIIWAVQANGPLGVLVHLFSAPKGDTAGLLKVLMAVVFFAVGFLEVISILFRPVSLSFRLYGNIFAGEQMLESMARLIPHWLGGIIVPIPFYFMELLVGFVQALVFMLLTAVFTMLICPGEDEHGKAQHT